MPYGSITPTAESDGVLYANAVPLTTSEATLGDGLVTPATIPTTFGEAIVAVVVLSINGFITANNTYVVLQMDMGDDVWVDLCWCVWSGSQGTATFVFSNGVAGANSFQQSRGSGQFPQPQAVGSNQMALGGRLRFVGKSTMVGGSSSLAGVSTRVSATIRYKLLGLR